MDCLGTGRPLHDAAAPQPLGGSMSKSFLFLFVAAAAMSACSDGASSRQITAPGPVLRSGGISGGGGGGGGGGIDTSIVSGGGGGGAGGGGGGSSNLSCGKLTNVQTQNNIVVYTTRTGIGMTGGAYNCGSHNESFEVDF